MGELIFSSFLLFRKDIDEEPDPDFEDYDESDEENQDPESEWGGEPD